MTSPSRLSYFAVLLITIAIAGCSHTAPRQAVSAKPDTTADNDTLVKPVSYNLPSLKGSYAMNWVCNTDSHLTITSVRVTNTKTIIDLQFNNVQIGDEIARDRIRTAAPGQQTAFYIADPNRHAEYALLNVEGIALEPKWTQLLAGDVVNFRLTFERIPDTLTSFHLIEGKTPSIDTNHEIATTWTFMNVRLK